MKQDYEPMILGIVTAIAFLLVAVITFSGIPPTPPAADGERISYRR